MGELLYLYLKENNLLSSLASDLVVERNVELIKKEKSDKEAYFEGSRYIDNKDFRQYLDCYEYTYSINTRFYLEGKVVFSYVSSKVGISVEEERPFDVTGNANSTMDYYDAGGKEIVEYQKTISNVDVDYRLKHVCYNGNSKSKAFRLPTSLKELLKNEDSFANIICKIYQIDIENFHNERARLLQTFDKIEIIDAEIARLQRLREDLINQVSFSKTKSNHNHV